MAWLHRFLLRYKIYREIIAFTQRVSFPGFQSESIYSVMRFFYVQMSNEDLNMRSSALAFNFFLALFPAIIFMFTLIAYVPINDTKDEVLRFFQVYLPDSTFQAIKSTINDILRKKHGNLLSIGFLLALYFSSNGFFSLMKLFNKYSHAKETRSFYKQRLISIFLAVFNTVLIVVAVGLITIGESGTHWLITHHFIKGRNVANFILVLRWIVTLALFFTTISSLFYFAPSKKHKFKFISAGSTVASILCVISSILFSYYVNNFGSYNTVYGSIGTLIVVLVLIQFNCMILQIGFELNVSIESAVKKHRMEEAQKKKVMEEEEAKVNTVKIIK
jgi:membrane protein